MCERLSNLCYSNREIWKFGKHSQASVLLRRPLDILYFDSSLWNTGPGLELCQGHNQVMWIITTGIFKFFNFKGCLYSLPWLYTVTSVELEPVSMIWLAECWWGGEWTDWDRKSAEGHCAAHSDPIVEVSLHWTVQGDPTMSEHHTIPSNRPILKLFSMRCKKNLEQSKNTTCIYFCTFWELTPFEFTFNCMKSD